MEPRNTTPISNILQDLEEPQVMRDFALWMVGLGRGLAASGTSMVQAHKDLFGRQSFCFTGEFRHWVWEFDRYSVYVSKRGVCIEVLPEVDAETAEKLLREYMSKWESL